jgi:histidinol-phosphate aminotransferase
MNTPIKRRDVLKRGALLTGLFGLASTVIPGKLFANGLPDGGTDGISRGGGADGFGEAGDGLSQDADFETTPMEIKARLSANENPFGPSAKAKQAMVDAMQLSYRYPINDRKKLIDAICSFEGIREEQLILDAGSSPLLQAAATHYSSGTIVSANPTYEDLLKRAQAAGGKVIRVPLDAEYRYDLPALEAAIDETTSLVYICNPNNPTATVIEGDKLRDFCKRVSKKVPVFIDEAYIDLCDDPQNTTMIPLVKDGYNIMVARTFSKLYGMAGLRCGYVVAQPDVIKKLSMLANGASSVSAITLAAAVASYRDKPYMEYAYKNITASRKYVCDVLKKKGILFVPSQTNFVVFPVNMDGVAFAGKMMEQGVGVRSFRFFSKEWCRVSIGKMEEMELFTAALDKIV